VAVLAIVGGYLAVTQVVKGWVIRRFGLS